MAISVCLAWAACGDDGGGNKNDNDNENGNAIVCGDGRTEGLEECDEGSANSDSSPDACRTDCRLARCGDGVADTGEACDDGVLNADEVPDRCRSDCQPPRCGDGVVDALGGERCDDGNLEPGDGCSPACIVEYCGNQVLDPGEECDDGGYLPGDGCGPTCLGERCGNGFVDPGESCDLEDLASQDGCSSGCAVEIPMWTETLSGTPMARASFVLVSDHSVGAVLLFGGINQTGGVTSYLADTWTLRAGVWRRALTEQSPLGRSAAAAAFDPRRGRVTLFGGRNLSTALGDTWEWDGESWHQGSPGQAPHARYGHAMAFDPVRQTILLFGGYYYDGSYNHLDDTWEWDGSGWHEIPVSSAPPPRRYHGLTMDPLRGRILLFGGEEGSQQKDDTWEWDGAGWALLNPAESPPPRRSHVQVFDPIGQEILVQGGSYHDVMSRYRTDSWSFDGADWTLVGGTTGPIPSRHEAGAAYEPASSELLLFGGWYYDSQAHYLGDLWAWDGSDWAARSPVSEALPSHRGSAAVTADPLRGELVLFGGYRLEGQPLCLSDTWRFGQGGWTELGPGPSPSGRHDAAFAYDPARDEAILFGGVCGTTLEGDTWSWSPSAGTWTERLGSPAPRARSGHALAADALRGNLVLFGGSAYDDGELYLGDTWLWDGASWAELTLGSGPAPRRRHAMVWDAAHQVVLCFGGATEGGHYQGDTWTFDGSAWTEHPTAVAPPARWSHGMTYDAARRTVLLHGGEGLGGVYQDLWEWDGLVWRALSPADRPPGRKEQVFVHDAPGRRSLLLLGRDGSSLSEDRWSFRYSARDEPRERCLQGFDGDGDGLVGCADPDCAGFCEPLCHSFGLCAPPGPRCGDGLCDPLESCRLCPSDCGSCAPVCGDARCDIGEDHTSCPGDC
ncbi:MAG: kelch repeat-containing protein [Polyangia bacterium]|jgi:cysteine-rich repeat protein|nr:kelch repeat-containing protein [Polyangia bacterium]